MVLRCLTRRTPMVQLKEMTDGSVCVSIASQSLHNYDDRSHLTVHPVQFWASGNLCVSCRARIVVQVLLTVDSVTDAVRVCTVTGISIFAMLFLLVHSM